MEHHIQLTLYATLRRHLPECPSDHRITPGETVGDVLSGIGVDPSAVKLIFINGRQGSAASVLSGGERVGVFPPVGGG